MPSLSQYSELTLIRDLARKRRVRVYVVGGFLRDQVLGREAKDLDFAVSRNAILFAKAFAKMIQGAFVLLDEENGCARVAKKKSGVLWTYDFADLRAATIQGDLKKRDFTINTLAVDISDLDLNVTDGIVLDRKRPEVRAALKDINAKTVRLAAPKAFVNDPLRLLRAYSLKAQLGFKIEARTLQRIKKDKALIRDVSPERIREELFKLFDSPRAAETLKAMDAVGLLTGIMPQLEVMRDVQQGGYHHLDVWKHSLLVLAEFEKLIASLDDHADIGPYLNEEIAGGHSRQALVKFACLLHDIGKPDTKKKEPSGRTSFHGHEHIGRRITRIIAKNLMLSTKERYALEDMVTLHLRPGYLSNFKKPSDKAVYRFMREAKDEAVSVLLLSIADQRSTRGPLTTEHDLKHHEAIARPLIEAYFAKKKEKPFVRLISGHDLIKELGLKPGPEFAKILTAVEEAQHLGEIETHQEALSMAKRMVREQDEI